MLTSPENLAQRILSVVRRAALEETTRITLELKRDLSDYYKSLHADADVRYTDRERTTAEYLVDFCVISDHRMDTALESEWNPNLAFIEYDFEKLLHLKASLKVMVCDSPDYVRGKLVPAANFLKAGNRGCDPEETYMIFNWRGNRAVANCHIWTPGEIRVADNETGRFRCVPGFPAEVGNKMAQPNDGWLGELDYFSL